MTALISQSEFSRMVNRTRQQINGDISRGKIGVQGKKVNTEDPITQEYIATCAQNDLTRGVSVPPEPRLIKSLDPVKRKPRQQRQPRQPKVPPKEKPEYNPDTPLESYTKHDLDRFKAIEDIVARKQRTAEKRNELISRETVQKALNKLYQIHVNQLQTLDANIIPYLAAIYGSKDPVNDVRAAKIVKDEMFGVLARIKKEFNEFMTEVGAEEIPDE